MSACCQGRSRVRKIRTESAARTGYRAQERFPETMSETIVLEKDQTIDRRLDLRWDGTNFSAPDFDVGVKGELRRRGGLSYLRFYTGDYGSEQFEKFQREVFRGVWFNAKLDDASFDDPNAQGLVLYPPRYLEFAQMFIDGAINISHKKSNYSVKQMRKFMSEGDRCLFGHLCNMIQGASAPNVLVHTLHGQRGSVIRSKLMENFLCQPESSTTHFQQLHSAFHCDTVAMKPYPFTPTDNIRHWIGNFKILRCDMARQLDNEEAKAGCLAFGDGSFSACIGYAAGRVRKNCNGMRKRMCSSEVKRILMLEWQAYIQMVANSKPFVEVRPDKFGQASSLQSPYGRFTVPCAYPYQWNEQVKRFVDTRDPSTASGLEIISSDEEKESESEVESDNENETVMSQNIATGKLSKIRNGSMFKNRIDAPHGGRVKRSAQQCKTQRQKKSKTENSGM